jgi:dolichyl-phosphate beta-glucosyltransferase
LTSLSIVIPAYNEQRRISSTLEAIAAWVPSQNLTFFELLIVNDGSKDETAAIVEGFRRKFPVASLLNNPGNRGKGYSVRHGMIEAGGEWRLFTDADLSTPIEEAETLHAAAVRAGAAIAIGSRALDRSLVSQHQAPLREYSGRAFNLVMRWLTGLPFADTQCGFKLYRADAARAVFSQQQLDGFSFDVEDLYIARRLGIPAIEVPVRWANVEGTKVSLRAGLRSFTDLLRIRHYAGTGWYK